MKEIFRRKEGLRPSPRSYPCPSCGFLVFGEPPGSYEICGICGWEDDRVQLADPTYSGGANDLSLATSQKEILKSLPVEIVEHNGFRRDPQWRPLRDEDLRERSDGEPDYYWLGCEAE
ncbi:MAG TPA: CPCC family cysteine-rich protein [Acidobacteriota bacterium]|nr:CPCC family cysteine-rich protein [Acidobacteriota bacterium]